MKSTADGTLLNVLSCRAFKFYILRRLIGPPHKTGNCFLTDNLNVEQLINRLKQWSRIAMGYEKLAANYTAMITIACILL
ncbi:hypothetical protein [Oscillatoria nigro-viridis]|uniref:hypothetical protein n=1 Tax=Phormidium nigroviride TaxID=482564 RepID=UPI000307F2A5